jgi:uncharacterized protein YycO
MLLKAAGINGVVGGTRQAIFWCFARMGKSYLYAFFLHLATNHNRHVGWLSF